jgi:NAD(P)-dependent dehydrogenase (short-subunit alcohol dehydrogenase family)
MTNRKTEQKEIAGLPEGSLDRRDLLAGAAGIAATVFGSQALAGGHQAAAKPVTGEDAVAIPVGEGAQILITGANRGLGFEFARQYSERGCKIIATARKPEKADALNALAAANGNIVVEKLDVTDHAAIDALAEKYQDMPIDLLLNNAGIGGHVPSQQFTQMDYSVFDKVFAVNVKGPMKMCEAFYKQVRASELKRMITVSSSQGSISSVNRPDLYFYRASKSAVNMLMANLALQLKRKKISVGMVTPGMTATDFIPDDVKEIMEKSRPGLMQTPEKATEDMMRNIDRFSLANTGTFFDYTGDIVPW